MAAAQESIGKEGDSVLMEGWLWKKPPTQEDSDKSRLRRASRALFTKDSTAFQRRWFALRPGTNPFQKDVLWYYTEKPTVANHTSAARGSIEVETMISASKCTYESTASPDTRGSISRGSISRGSLTLRGSVTSRGSAYSEFKKTLQGQFAIELRCKKRTFLLGAESEAEQETWLRALQRSMDPDSVPPVEDPPPSPAARSPAKTAAPPPAPEQEQGQPARKPVSAPQPGGGGSGGGGGGSVGAEVVPGVKAVTVDDDDLSWDPNDTSEEEIITDDETENVPQSGASTTQELPAPGNKERSRSTHEGLLGHFS